MKALLLSFGLLAAGTVFAGADDVKVETRTPAITVPLPIPGTVERRDRVETTGNAGCNTKSVTKEGVEGSKTVTRSNC